MTHSDPLFGASPTVNDAIHTRRSMRAFTDQEVSDDTIQRLLNTAARSPSGTNTQPWKVYVLKGETRNRVVSEVCAAHDALRQDPGLASQYQSA